MKTKEDFSNRDRFVELGVVITALRKKAGMSQEDFERLWGVIFNARTTNRYTGLTSNCTGEKRQIPIPTGHFLNGIRGQRFDFYYLVIKNIPIYVCKSNCVPLGKIFEMAKVAFVVMCRNDHVVQISRAGVPAWCNS